MAKIPRTAHVQARPANTDKQKRIIAAVEELYPGVDLKDIASLSQEDIDGADISDEAKDRLRPIDVNPSTVSRTVDGYMQPEDDRVYTEPDEDDFDVPSGVDPRTYVKIYVEGFKAGFRERAEIESDNNNNAETGSDGVDLSSIIAEELND